MVNDLPSVYNIDMYVCTFVGANNYKYKEYDMGSVQTQFGLRISNNDKSRHNFIRFVLRIGGKNKDELET